MLDTRNCGVQGKNVVESCISVSGVGRALPRNCRAESMTTYCLSSKPALGSLNVSICHGIPIKRVGCLEGTGKST
eukprot:1275313-Rhodomonas_salina.2